jgi:hypothetical protein
MRAERLGIVSDQLFVVSETSLEKILQDIQTLKPSAAVVDSIQTIYSSDLPSTPGSIGQVREASSRLLYLAKHLGIPIFLVGHVTKEGFIAGPKVLEHMVDTVLYIEGEAMLLFMDMEGVRISSGSACISRSLKVSHVMLAMGVDAATAQGSLLFSFGMQNKPQDVDHILQVLPPIVERLRNMSPVYRKAMAKKA